MRREQDISRRVGQLQDEQDRHQQRKRKFAAELEEKRSKLSIQKSSLREAQRELVTAREQQEEAKSSKKRAIAASVATGFIGAAASVVTLGIAAPFALAGTVGLLLQHQIMQTSRKQQKAKCGKLEKSFLRQKVELKHVIIASPR